MPRRTFTKQEADRNFQQLLDELQRDRPDVFQYVQGLTRREAIAVIYAFPDHHTLLVHPSGMKGFGLWRYPLDKYLQRYCGGKVSWRWGH